MDTDYYTAAPRPDMPAFAQTLGKKYEIYGGQVPALRRVESRSKACQRCVSSRLVPLPSRLVSSRLVPLRLHSASKACQQQVKHVST